MNKNKSNGLENEKAQMQKKEATSSEGRHNQPRGSAEHNTKPRKAKFQKLGKTEDTSMVF